MNFFYLKMLLLIHKPGPMRLLLAMPGSKTQIAHIALDMVQKSNSHRRVFHRSLQHRLDPHPQVLTLLQTTFIQPVLHDQMQHLADRVRAVFGSV